MTIFTEQDVAGLFDDHPSGFTSYTEAAPDDDAVAAVETELGYRLPAAYIELARTVRNGGLLQRDCFPIDGVPVWAEDHVTVTGIYAIGGTSTYSLLGDLGSTFMLSEWGYPPIGVCFADTPTAGHSEFMLDYRACGPDGELAVVVVDQEDDYSIWPVAPDFATFIRGLVTDERFEEDPAETLAEALSTVDHGTFSPIVERGIRAVADLLPDADESIRAIGRRVVTQKGHFSLHGDDDSRLMYDAMFLLLSAERTVTSMDDFIDRDRDDYSRACYELMIPTSLLAERFGFTTGGWARDFVTDWWEARVANGSIIPVDDGWRFSPEADAHVVRLLREAALMR